jgi:hypothetical protein
MKPRGKRAKLAAALALPALFAANLAVTACGTNPADEAPPLQRFGSSPTVIARPVVYGFFTDTSETANAVMDDLASIGAHVVIVPTNDLPGITAARRASSDGIAGYLALVIPDTVGDDAGTNDEAGVPATSCDQIVATTTAQFDSIIDAAPDLRRFYLPEQLGVSLGDCLPTAAATIAQHIREAGPANSSIAIAPALDDNTACDDVCVDHLTATWTGFLQNAQIDVVMLNDGVLGNGIDPAVARSYFAPFAQACANAHATFFVTAESNVGANRASATDFFARLDFYADAGLDAQVLTRTVEVDAAWACTTDAGCTDDLRLCQATRLSGGACQ